MESVSTMTMVGGKGSQVMKGYKKEKTGQQSKVVLLIEKDSTITLQGEIGEVMIKRLVTGSFKALPKFRCESMLCNSSCGWT